MSFATGATPIWPVPPDWADGVRETLDWLTNHLPARNGKAQKRELRQAPRRVLEFSVINDEQGRRVADAILNDAGGKYWLLPMWHDVQLLVQPLASGSSSIACAPAGRDFRADGQALLWAAINDWAVLEVDDVVDGAVVLKAATTRTWPAGTRLYGLRGRMQTLWVPTWNNDLKIANDISSTTIHITVEWAGYTSFGRMQANRRDIRIELLDGTVFYRRITASQEDGNAEVLTLDAALGVLVQRLRVRQISFLVLAEQSTDTAELLHDTDIEGLTRLTTSFIGVRNDDI